MVKLVSVTPDPPPPPRPQTWQATILSADGWRIQTNIPADTLPNGVRPLCSCAHCNAIRNREMQSRRQEQAPYILTLPPLHVHH